ncbi:SRPBCC family protein [Nocardiopsis sp. FIRDI 009]|uniref:SRPBCC family protein n=1 Tax=Nocardiopsis sp. FIRDI 009 TaxID=714197 RepID=UPI000E25806D|nr:SRPBCC family protein [Nocardiopsis sp. FIRDI 009]
MDVEAQIGSVGRTVSTREVEGGREGTVVVTRSFEATPEDLWDACTNAERLPRWFLPVSGDLREGGSYRLEGNAHGRVLACDPPRSFRASWEFGGEYSEIAVRLIPVSDTRTRIELSHSARLTEHWTEYGPGAVGIGWDLGVLGLTLHLERGGQEPPETAEWARSAEARRFTELSGRAWGEAHIASGMDAATAKAAANRTVAAYTGEGESGF